MHGEIIAIDLETTGLDASKDAIIEIGLARYKDGQILETWETLIDPEREIPPFITSITGIRQDDVIGKPRINDVRRDIEQFIGDAPVLGHNIGFDVGFLRRYDMLYTNVQIDTYELASVLLPTAPRYNLNSLSQQLGVALDDAHRALADAIATGHVYWALWQRLLELPLDTIQEIVDSARGLLDDWKAGPVFMAALETRAHTAMTDGSPRKAGASVFEGDLFKPQRSGWQPLQPNANLQSLNADQVAALLEQDGEMASQLAGYEHRPEQIKMLRAVVEAFNNRHHLMVEAGTGTGKSIAYLLPAIYWSLRNNERVVISTDTINLQEQLLNKDIPLLKQLLGLEFTAAVVKGRNNYLCPRRLATMRRRRPTTVDELRVYAKVLLWLLESSTGDRSEINLRGASELGAWSRLSAEDDGCTLDRCQTQMHGTCPFYKARRRAEEAHILIVNHALLLADVAAGSRVLPKYDYVVLDEAHHLEEATTNGLSFRLDQIALRRQLAELGGQRSGILGDLLSHARGAIPETHLAQLSEYVASVEEAIQAMEFHVNSFFNVILDFLKQNRLVHNSTYVNQVRITEQVRSQPSFSQVQAAWDTLSQFTTGISKAMNRLAMALGRLGDYDIEDYDDIVNNIGAAARNMDEIHQQLEAFTHKPDANQIYWVEVGQDQFRMSLHSAPLHVGPLIEEHLWQAKESVILTSATLQTAGSFDYIRDRLQATEVKTLDVGSPFNYHDSTLLYLPTDIPEPNAGYQYQEAVEEALIGLAAATGGRLMGLFTSYTQLRKTAQSITPRLALGNINVFDQSDGSSRQALLEGFKETEKAVLLGTRSFWEGVDIPGDDLSVLVIARLPFAVPSDPIFSARSETFENSFAQYAIPDAILRFRQGFGRLIRTRTDRGVIVILDRRILSKSYGRFFLDSLPECTVMRKPLANLVPETTAWLSTEPEA
ncbi:MAG: DEAD/DEAH box helicase [Anaerolineae bacterium]|nr:DEAD/DEAH box helicase [Anaerolineae bacterium]